MAVEPDFGRRPLAPRIRVVAPAGPVAAPRLAAGLAWLRARGLEPVPGRALARVHGHLAGEDGERAADLEEALLDAQAAAVWAARGGFGGLRLLARLDWERLRAAAARPPLVGYSDLTSLQNALATRLDWPCWHAPMVATELDGELDPLSAASLDGLVALLREGPGAGRRLAARQDAAGEWALCPPAELAGAAARVVLETPGFRQELGLHADFVWRRGRAAAPSAGGNLSVLTSLFGGPGAPSLAGRCLWLEDHGEFPFRLDRHLAQLDNAGGLAGAAALLLGSFLDCEEPDPAKSTFTARELLRHYAGRVAGPVLAGLPFGHRAPRLCLPLHGRCLVAA